MTDNSDRPKLSFKVKSLNLFRAIFKIEFLGKWLATKTAGKPVDSFYAKLSPNNHQYSPGTVKHISRDGLNFSVDLYDYIGHYIYFGFSDNEMKKLFSLANKDDTIIDIGANYGYVSLNLAKRVGPDGFIYSFEPDPKNYKVCLDNLNQNQFKNIKLENKGLGPREDKMFLEIAVPNNRGGNRISKEPSKEHSLVDIIRLDDYVEANNIQRIQLIKMDVEGFEHQILKGSMKVLEKFHPVLFIEIDDNNLRMQGDTTQGLLQLLMSIGYTDFERADTGEKITVDSSFSNVHYDIICR